MSDDASTAARARPGRITEQESFLDLIDQLAYGDLETWRRLYLAALVDPRMRENIVRAAQRVDPDFVTAGHVWDALVSRMPTLAGTLGPSSWSTCATATWPPRTPPAPVTVPGCDINVRGDSRHRS